MGLLLKSLQRIDWKPVEAPAEEEISAITAPVQEVQLEETLLEHVESQSAASDAADDLTPQAFECERPEVAEQAAPENIAAGAEEQFPAPIDFTLPPEVPPAREPEAVVLQPIEPEPSKSFGWNDSIPQTTEESLERLNELHALIDAALEEFSNPRPIVVEAPAADPADSAPEIAAEELRVFEPSVKFSPIEASQATVVPVPALFTPVARPEPAIAVPSVKLRDEYRELRDHLLARFPMDEPCTLLAIDAGRATSDAAWMAPFAACLWESLSEQSTLQVSSDPPKILLVEAAGAECGIARHLGLDCPLGLADILNGTADWSDTLQPTYHPHIELLSCGKAALVPRQGEQLSNLWSELQERYQVIMVAAGPWEAVSQASWRKTGMATAAVLLPVADAAVLCVELEGTPQSAAIDTKQALERRGIRLLGSVVTGK